MSQPPFVSLIVVNRNGQPHLERLMPSLEALTYPKDRLEVIVVDNRSSDGSAQWLAKRYATVRTLAHGKNNFCAANNFGIRHASGSLLGMLNNDCWVEPKWLDRLVAAVQQDQRIGAVGSKILFEDGTIDSVGLHELPNFYWADVGFYEPDHGQYEAPQERLAVCAASMLIRRECFEEVGGFDEDFVIYYDDVDWCLRCRLRDWQIRYVPDSIAWHRLHGTCSADMVRWYTERNRLILVAKHAPQHLPSALENAPFFLERESLEPLCHVIEVACGKLLQTHGKALAAPILLQVVQRFAKFARSHSKTSVVKLQQTLGRVRGELERKNVEQYELALLKDAGDRSLQRLAEELDTQQAMIAQLHQEGAERQRVNAQTTEALQQAQDTLASLQRQLAEARHEHETLRRTHDALQQAHGALQQAQRDTRQAYEALRANHDAVRADHAALQAELRTQAQALGAWQQQLTEEQQRHAALRRTHEDLQRVHGALQQAHADLQQAYTQLRENHLTLQAVQASLQAGHDHLQQRHATLEKDHGALQQAHADLQHALTTLRADHGVLEQACADLQQTHNVLLDNHQELQGAHIHLQEDHERLRRETQALEQRDAALQQTHQQLYAEHQGLLEEHGRVFHDRETLRQEVQRLRRTPWWVARDALRQLSMRLFSRGFAMIMSRMLMRKHERSPSLQSTKKGGSMRTARVLKWGSWLVLLAGGGLAAETVGTHPASAFAWLTAGLVGTLSVRVFANIGQMCGEQRGELQRVLSNVERSLYQQSALTKELRDMVKERLREQDRERVTV